MSPIAAFLLAAAAPQPASEPARAAVVAVAQARAEILRAERVSASADAGALTRILRRGPHGTEIAFQ